MDRIVVVTGATGGLGGAVVKAYFDEGDTVVALYRRASEFDRLVEEMGGENDRIQGVQSDVTDATSVEAAIETVSRRFGRIDALAHLVGGYRDGVPVSETTDEMWDSMMTINLRSAFNTIRAVLPRMIARKKGKIVAISSRSALQVYPGIGAYAAAKAGIIALVKVAAAEVAEVDIQVNCVLPSIIDTPTNRDAMPDADFETWVKPEEIASVVTFLTSDAASKISGAAIPVTGRS